MPAIRGATYAATTVATGTTLTLPMPDYAEGDLLVAILSADTGTNDWSSTGWTVLFKATNTAQLSVLYKIAGASESDPTFTRGAAESFNGALLAIRDIDAKTPWDEAIYASYAESNQDGGTSLNNTVTAVGQAFTGSGGILESASFYLKKTNTPSGNMVAKVYAHSGTFGTSSVPTGSALATSDPIDASTLTTSYALTKFVFPSGQWFPLVSGTNYVVVIEYSGGTSSNTVEVGHDASAPGHGGNLSTFANPTWTADSAKDACFYVRFASFTTGTTSAARASFPSHTTDRDDCLILWCCSHSAAAVPSVIEGPVVGLYAQDGIAESSGAGWGMQRTAGSTPTTVFMTNLSAAAAQLAVLAVNPPSSGATVIPAYTAADASIYLDPLNGTTAFNGNSTPAQDPTTIFGTSLQGLTLVSDVATAVADYGLNSYHSAARVTADVVTPVTWRGSRIQLASGNRPNMTGKALLLHTGPSTTGQLQRLRSIAKAQGIAIGMGSGAASGNWKIWHAHGEGTPFGALRDVPLVIHPDNTQQIGSAGTFDKTSLSDVCFLVAGQVLGSTTTTIWDFYSMWALDTITIAGGSSAEPMTVDGIVNAIWGHEHRGVLREGQKQMLALMPIQIGDGGTNPVYLDLDGTAIEFPRQYSITDKLVNFCGVDNWAGLLYYPGASDTIKHRNAVVSSKSRFKWGLHGSASASATYDFSGLLVIGAGTITLNKAITIVALTINDYSTLDVSSATLDGCVIKNPPSANDSITTNASTNIDSSQIDTTTVGEGNRWWSGADPSIFSGNAFTGDHEAHALRVTTAGTYSFVGNTFSGYGPDQRDFNTTTSVTEADDTVTITGHGYLTGDPIRYYKRGGTAAIGLTDDTTYWVRKIDNDKIAFYATEANALADTSRIALTATGGETHQIASIGAAIFVDVSGTTTINVSGGGSTPSIRSRNGATVVVNNSKNFTISQIPTGCRVVVYRTSDNAVLGETTNSSTSFTYAYNYTADTAVYFTVYKFGYVFEKRNATLTSSDQTIPVPLRPDLVAANP